MGTAAVQLVSLFGGRSIVTAGSQEKIDKVTERKLRQPQYVYRSCVVYRFLTLHAEGHKEMAPIFADQ